MRKIDIDSTPTQELSIPFENDYIFLKMMFRDDCWIMNARYRDKVKNGLRVSCGVLMLTGFNLPFDFTVLSKIKGLDPFLIDSFESGNFELYLLERDELIEIRGNDVP